MIHLRGLVPFLLFLPGGARRTTSNEDSHHDAEQQHTTLANDLEVSAETREALIPSGFGMRVFPSLRPHAGTLLKQDGWRAGLSEPHRIAPRFRFGPRRAKVSLQDASGTEENQLSLKEELDDEGRRKRQMAKLEAMWQRKMDSTSWVVSTLAAAPPATSPTVMTLREAAVDAARAVQLPTRRDEAWRRTDMSSLFATRMVAPTGEAPSAALLEACLDEESEGTRLVFVDGTLSAELSNTSALPDGVLAGSLSTFPERVQAEAFAQLQVLPEVGVDKRDALGCFPFAAINQASLADVAYVHVPSAVDVERPLYVFMLSTGPDGGIGSGSEAAASHPNLLVMLESGAQLDLVQYYSGSGAYFANALSRMRLAEGAKLTHVYVEEQAKDAVHLDSVLVAAQTSSHYELRVAQMGGKLTRVNVEVKLQGPYASTSLNGLALATGRELSDFHSKVVHESRDCKSVQVQRNAVSDAARIVFRGKINVSPGAANTTADQQCRSLLLSEKARVDVSPQLEIIPSEVECTHGATVADLDEEMVFYLQTRGLNRLTARALLLEGWARDVMNNVPLAGSKRRAVARATQLSQAQSAGNVQKLQSA